jgi:hypothetical protein
MMNISTKTIIVVGIVQSIVLTLMLILFFQYQRMLEAENVQTETEFWPETSR